MEESAPSSGFKICSICHNNVLDPSHFCNKCGYPVNGTQEEKDTFNSDYNVKRFALDDAMKAAKKGTTTLFVLSGLIFIGNVVFYAITKELAYLIAGIIVPVLFILLAFWSKTKPFTALVVAIVFYVTIILADAFADPATIYKGIIVKIIVITSLVRSIRSAREAQGLMKELEIKNWNQ